MPPVKLHTEELTLQSTGMGANHSEHSCPFDLYNNPGKRIFILPNGSENSGEGS